MATIPEETYLKIFDAAYKKFRKGGHASGQMFSIADDFEWWVACEVYTLVVAKDKRIEELKEALRMYMSNAADAADCFEDGNNDTAYEYLMVAKTRAKHELSKGDT